MGAREVELVLERQPQEPIQPIADALIDDGPYQARQPISPVHVAELAQEQGIPCMLPVVVRTITDAQMLTIGAQENLQRQDLDPVEEGQIVAWLERMYFDKNQSEIGALLGKSSDWVSTRSRIYRLPEPLKALLRQRPRAIKQMLEIAPFYAQDAAIVIALAEQVHTELTVEDLRQQLAAAFHIPHTESGIREEKDNRRDVATSVQSITNTPADSQPSLDSPAPGMKLPQYPLEPPASTAPQRDDRQDNDETADENVHLPPHVSTWYNRMKDMLLLDLWMCYR